MLKRVVLSLLCAYGIVTSPALAQTASGVIGGIVQDPTSAPVAGAKVTIENVGSGLTRTLNTQNDGTFVSPALPVGQYRIQVEQEGFRAYQQTGIVLAVDATLRLRIPLQLGARADQVTVSADASMLQTESGTLKQLINEQQIVELPLNGRNPESLVFLTAGTVRDTRTSSTYVYGSSIIPDTQTPSVNGTRSNGVTYRLDGANNNDNYTGVANPFPDPDALREFNVQTNGFSAEYGNAAGGVVNILTKSGTNSFHGSAFEFLRNGAVNARNYFAPTSDNLKRNQFGGTLGGPVVRNRIFFFGSYQGTRTRSTQNGLSQTVLTDAMRSGDFSKVAGTLIDPLTNQAFPNRQIPVSRMDPAALKLLQYMPHSADPNGLLYYSLPTRTDLNEYLGKSDQILGNHQVYERFFQYDLSSPAILPNPNILTQIRNGNTIRVQTVGVGDTWTVSPTLLNTFTFTWSHNRGMSEPNAPFGLADIGVNVAQPTIPALGVSISGYSGFSTIQSAQVTRGNLEFADTASSIHGKHQIIFGAAGNYLQQDIYNDFRKNASFTFSSDITGNSAANFLLGDATSFTQGGGEFKALRGWRVNMFVQDNYRVSNSLTVNLGVRLDPWMPYTDELGRVACFRPGEQSQRFVNAPAGLIYAGDPGCPDGGVSSQPWEFSPRFGFAWNPGGHSRWTVRGGYGIFYAQPETVLYNRFVDLAPFSPQVALSGVSFSNPYAGITNPFPAAYAPRTPSKTDPFVLPALAVGFDPNFVPENIQNWNFTLERQLGSNSVVRAAYVASKGTRLRANLEQNYARYAPGATVANTQSRRPYPNFSSIVQTYAAGNSSYQSLQLTYEKRFSNHVSVLANYTWSKSIDENSANTVPNSSDVPNPASLAANRGVSDFDVPHRFVLDAVYALPLLDSFHPVLRGIFGGWQLSGIVNWQSGFPFSVVSGRDNSFSGLNLDRADLIDPNALMISGSRPQSVWLNQYFNTADFRQNAAGTFGNGGRNILRGPSSFNTDVSAQKIFALTERWKLQFRAEFFNATNTPTFDLPTATLTSTSFGRILTAEDPRILQFSLKVTF